MKGLNETSEDEKSGIFGSQSQSPSQGQNQASAKQQMQDENTELSNTIDSSLLSCGSNERHFNHQVSWPCDNVSPWEGVNYGETPLNFGIGQAFAMNECSALIKMQQELEHLAQMTHEAEQEGMKQKFADNLIKHLNTSMLDGWRSNDLDLILTIAKAWFVLAGVCYNKRMKTETDYQQGLEYVNRSLFFFKRCNQLVNSEIQRRSSMSMKTNAFDKDCSSEVLSDYSHDSKDNEEEDEEGVDKPLSFADDWGVYWDALCEVYCLGGFFMSDERNFTSAIKYFQLANELAQKAYIYVQQTQTAKSGKVFFFGLKFKKKNFFF
ncbi:hypothetical protein RFI_06903 [Reticulomyxa filosa]|uniref:Uncharacterized protein n=1 Tax=Reticulomyxa filosa TaxID=46433 RepID=X6NWL3_RETFI|nr:hypothetical protein RFI_06903 [Reticulomyxa filosa]|eukprot:ETO30219.1 hypothetical protein RFI_06903 [Reticulomyxa filosa]